MYDAVMCLHVPLDDPLHIVEGDVFVGVLPAQKEKIKTLTVLCRNGGNLEASDYMLGASGVWLAEFGNASWWPRSFALEKCRMIFEKNCPSYWKTSHSFFKNTGFKPISGIWSLGTRWSPILPWWIEKQIHPQQLPRYFPFPIGALPPRSRRSP